MGALETLRTVVTSLGSGTKADYEKQVKQLDAENARLVRNTNTELGKDLTSAQVEVVVKQLTAVHSLFTGKAVELAKKHQEAPQASGVGQRVSALWSTVRKSVHKGPAERAQIRLSTDATQLNVLLAQANARKVALAETKKTLESATRSLPVSADSVKKVLNMSPSDLKTSAQAFYPAAGKTATYIVADKEAKNFEKLLLKIWPLAASDESVDIDILEKQLTDPKRALPKAGLPKFTQLLHFAAKPAEQVCQDTVTAKLAGTNIGLKPVSFTKVTYEQAGDQTVARSEASLVFTRKEGRKETEIATAKATLVTDLSGGKCTMTVRVTGIAINDAATESEINKLKASFVESSEQPQVAAVSSSGK